MGLREANSGNAVSRRIAVRSLGANAQAPFIIAVVVVVVKKRRAAPAAQLVLRTGAGLDLRTTAILGDRSHTSRLRSRSPY
jgi:hypothetical protein